ncbi:MULTISPECIES: 2-succinyl-5-enolpyruvyl-6-hydroxy-3-cyclohexene-1-carboxylic-acid synthase [Halobacterium]|nr:MULTISPECIES: 2-succinyl-5-enolpyruvyl-6-hydroxy-3-cyclohexene-1-carboxylic-acid synthase [Halobacterium]MCF2208116.1 2-succinyl-5-enolpyruvyl-6-hydroxy-3-cyclohexene-1-carboxylic-acid synthase [Halobacterium salinarum]MCF2238170.1 2-succinyl-5-enolpyruvyl-6-hydroxy-3-cyclohexene-1-carboxylic-acid synthase [Halobacterium salinarum]MDL0145877.1 2-succinyl-5-enolpyruvyl-6-hydroxy-3-cyclohexene-1-carboxylic-acid synthase [Halobacterium salinarum]QRY23518.1 2-succinyl-5-enolpyruvyl-6-hydroxy-3-c
MTAPNRNTLWARAIADELAAAGVHAVCVCPGSRSTPLTVAVDAHDDLTVYSHLDERSAAFFALGRGKRTGAPTAVLTTSGTATANLHPAVMEAAQARIPLVVLTADRPPELRGSGANQTVDQEQLYGSAVRYYEDLPEPEVTARKLRSLRTSVCRAVGHTTGSKPGPVHLNVPFRKPLEPVSVPGDVPPSFDDDHPLAAAGRDGDTPFVSVHDGTTEPAGETAAALAAAATTAARPLVVAGPADGGAGITPDAAAALADATGAPIFADPLSGLRFGPHVGDAPVVGGYDGFLAADVPHPEFVLRFGASPTSKPLRKWLAASDARQVVVDPAGGWREAEFTATDVVAADPAATARAIAARADGTRSAWTDDVLDLEARYWAAVDDFQPAATLEGEIAATVAAGAPDPATVFVSNSMPIRDFDRFAAPRGADLAVLGNRGASGIDGVISSALGAGSATADPVVGLVGDLAYFHDSNGLLALERCGVDATIVLVNNDGGSIFHMLPIEQFDPPFTGQFKTPHGLDFAPTADTYALSFARTDTVGEFRAAYRAALGDAGTHVIEVSTDAEASHRERERLADRVTGLSV